jgi:hypothetical protein
VRGQYSRVDAANFTFSACLCIPFLSNSPEPKRGGSIKATYRRLIFIYDAPEHGLKRTPWGGSSSLKASVEN